MVSSMDILEELTKKVSSKILFAVFLVVVVIIFSGLSRKTGGAASDIFNLTIDSLWIWFLGFGGLVVIFLGYSLSQGRGR